MSERWQFMLNRMGERLWVKPLLVCALSIAAVFLAHITDGTGLGGFVPDITRDSIESLLKIVAASMLVIATFSVASMVSAYASASSSATPRSFPLIIADDISQNALSTFIGVFIFSVVALVALMNGFYGKAGRFTLFALTMFVFALVIVTFVRWVDSIARLGRLGTTIDTVEEATAAALMQRQMAPRMGGVAVTPSTQATRAIYAESIGYVRHIAIAEMQAQAEKSHLRITVAALPGTFCTPSRPLAHIGADVTSAVSDADVRAITRTFEIGDARAFDQDPRFGLVALSEIASRALSPAVNDPGTAIDVIGTLVRLFALWDSSGRAKGRYDVRFDRVAVPEIALDDMFDDAFTGIARDGAGTVEVAVRLQKALEALSLLGNAAMRESALRQACLALVRSEAAMSIAHDTAAVQRAAQFADRTEERTAKDRSGPEPSHAAQSEPRTPDREFLAGN